MQHKKIYQRGYQRIQIFFLLRTNREKKIIVIACVIKININNCMNGADRDRAREKHVYYFHCNRNA